MNKHEFDQTGRMLLQHYGKFPVKHIRICRSEKGVLPKLTVENYEKWQQYEHQYGFDELFNLYMLIDVLAPNGEITTFKMQKYHTPTLAIYNGRVERDLKVADVIQVFTGGMKDMIDYTIANIGAGIFWSYNPITNDSRKWFLEILSTCKLLTPPLASFINESIEDMVIPPTRPTRKVGKPIGFVEPAQTQRPLEAYDPDTEEEGAGLWDDIKSKFKDILGYNKYEYTTKVKKFIEDHKDATITDLVVYRVPVDSAVKKLVNIISLGQFNKTLKEHYDEIFHMYLRISLSTGDVFILEKNQVIQINNFNSADRTNAQTFQIKFPPGIKFGEFIQKAQNSVSKEVWFLYDSLNYNCQRFIQVILKANGLLEMNPGIEPFLFQDLSKLRNELSSTTKGIMRSITDLAAWGSRVKGSGLQDFIANNPEMPNKTIQEFKDFVGRHLNQADVNKIVYNDSKLDPQKYDMARVSDQDVTDQRAADERDNIYLSRRKLKLNVVHIGVPKEITDILLSQGVPKTRKLEDIKYVLGPYQVFEYNIDGNNLILFGEDHKSASDQPPLQAYKPDTTNLYGYVEAIQQKGLTVKVFGENLRMMSKLPMDAGENTDMRQHYVDELPPDVKEFHRLLSQSYHYKQNLRAQLDDAEKKIDGRMGKEESLYTIIQDKAKEIVASSEISDAHKSIVDSYISYVIGISYNKYLSNFIDSFMDLFALFSDVPTLIEMYKAFESGIKNIIFINGSGHVKLFTGFFSRVNYPLIYSEPGNRKSAKVDVSKIILS